MTQARLIPASSPPATGDPWVLTPLDTANHFLVLRGTWIFQQPLHAARLREGLAALLVHYPHLAGRMRAGERVEFNNAGVPFSTAQRPDLTVAQLVEDHSLAIGCAPSLDKGRVKKGLDAPLAVRITALGDGSVLSVVATHACLDGTSFYNLVYNWSCLCGGRPFPLPVLDQHLVPMPERRSRAEVRQEAVDSGWRPPRLLAMLPTLYALLTWFEELVG